MAEWEWRCRGVTDGRRCNKLLGKFEDLRKGQIRCPRCGYTNNAAWPNGAPAASGAVKSSTTSEIGQLP